MHALMEGSVLAFGAWLCLDARRRGGPGLATLLSGMIAGLTVEALILLAADHTIPHYRYDTERFLHLFGVPVWVGVGWGLILHVSTWAAEQWPSPLWCRASIAGALAVNIDLSLEPAAQAHRFWTWSWPAGHERPLDYFGIPFDNFTGWFGFVAIFALCRQVALVLARRRWPEARWADLAAPPLAAIAAILLLCALRPPVVALYRLIGDRGSGHLVVLSLLLLLSARAFWVGRQPRGRAIATRAVLTFALYFHLLAFFLLVFGPGPLGALAWVVPLNAAGGLLAFAWPTLRRAGHHANPVGPVRRALSSYGGATCVARVHTPADATELRELLRQAVAARARFTFRAAGNSFDAQALNGDLVISLERFRGITVDVDQRTVRVGAAAAWGDILRETSRHALVPPILVTTQLATAGGTLSSDSISRFTPTLGREGRHIRSLRLMLLDGTELECSRQSHPELFAAVVGGLGYVGAVLEVTHQLIPVPCAAPRLVVETEFVRLTGARELAERLLQPAREPVLGPAAAQASSAVVHLHGPRHALLATSRYAEGRVRRRSRCAFHHPGSPVHWLLQLVAQIEPLRRLGNRLVFDRAFRQPRTFVDDLHGYTFFQDGNQRVRRWGRRLGLAMAIRQQTFMIPCYPRDLTRSTRVLEAFLDQAQTLLEAAGLVPALVDLLYVAADAEFSLSSSRDLPSLAVTFTFERLTSSVFTREEEILRQLSQHCEQAGGRVHLVKQVFAEAPLIERMYRDGLAELRRARTRAGAVGGLHNEFLERVLPSLALPLDDLAEAPGR
jgi:decaprenylphospho-beta-D-ribofuranose 2-oxidase